VSAKQTCFVCLNIFVKHARCFADRAFFIPRGYGEMVLLDARFALEHDEFRVQSAVAAYWIFAALVPVWR
jgi:hypothetical protein